VKTGWSNSQKRTNLAESSKEDHGSKRAVLPMMMMMMLVVMIAVIRLTDTLRGSHQFQGVTLKQAMIIPFQNVLSSLLINYLLI
jgi:hypothetical protein